MSHAVIAIAVVVFIAIAFLLLWMSNLYDEMKMSRDVLVELNEQMYKENAELKRRIEQEEDKYQELTRKVELLEAVCISRSMASEDHEEFFWYERIIDCEAPVPCPING